MILSFKFGDKKGIHLGERLFYCYTAAALLSGAMSSCCHNRFGSSTALASIGCKSISKLRLTMLLMACAKLVGDCLG